MFRHLTIKYKFVVANAFVLLALFIAAVLYFPSEIREAFIEREVNSVHTLSNMIAVSAGYGLGTEDYQALAESIQNLKRFEQLQQVDFYDTLGTKIATYGRNEFALADRTPNNLQVLISDSNIFIRKMVLYDGAFYGSLIIDYSLGSMNEAIDNFSMVAFYFGIGALLLGAVFMYFLSQIITNSLTSLANASVEIDEGDLSVRVPEYGSDEVGRLAKSFNLMVSSLQANREKLTKLNEQLKQFSSRVSHDLKAPLRAISGYAFILKEDAGPKLGSDEQEMLDKVTSEAERMSDLIDDILLFSRSASLVDDKVSVDMTKVFKEASDRVLAELDTAKTEILVNELPSCVGDEKMLAQVAINLVSNAVKYSAKVAAPIVEIGCLVQNDQPVYYVNDNGAGFDVNKAEALFEPFQRLHNDSQFEGTGVGLSFVKGIIEKHGGEIWAESEVGQGATFYFTLNNS